MVLDFKKEIKRAAHAVRTGRPRSQQPEAHNGLLDLSRTKSENASSKMKLTAEQIVDYECDGFLVLENFVDDEACERLRARAEELVRDFDPQGVVSIFLPHEQTRTSDDYIL